MLINLYLVLILFILPTTKVQQAEVVPEYPNGKVIYQQKISMSSTAINSDTLKFNRTKSIFHWNLYSTSNDGLKKAKQKYPGAQIKKIKGVGNGQVTLLDTDNDSLFSRMSMPNIGKLLYLKEKIPEINWAITDSTKKIGNYTVKKATAYFRGRYYTAWFTPQIPVPYGPWKLHGLPGLILQAYDKTQNIYFSATNISIGNVDRIESIALNGDEHEITLKEYKNITNNFKKYIKRDMLKKVRPYVSKEDFANMRVELPDVKLMEMFTGSTDQ